VLHGDRMTETTGTANINLNLTYYNLNKIKCEKCDGTGYQQRNDGIFVICPICEGTGWREVPHEYTPHPLMPYPPGTDSGYPSDAWYGYPYDTNETRTTWKYEIIC